MSPKTLEQLLERERIIWADLQEEHSRRFWRLEPYMAPLTMVRHSWYRSTHGWRCDSCGSSTNRRESLLEWRFCP